MSTAPVGRVTLLLCNSIAYKSYEVPGNYVLNQI